VLVRQSRHRIKPAARGAAFCVLLLLVSLASATAFTPAARAQSDSLPGVPDVTAKAVFSIDVSANTVLMAKNADEELPPASTTKIVTALVVVNNVNLDDQITIDPNDTVQDGESSMFVQAGDVLTVNQLLFGMMLPSGNDAARSLARYVGGVLLQKEGGAGDPIARFVQAMNDEVASLGLKHTHFTNPDGLEEKGLYSSARDLATLATALLQNDALAKIVDTPSIDITSQTGVVYNLLNTNEMLTDGTEGVHGVKTGGTSEAGACLVLATWSKGENHIITVVLGSGIAYDDQGYVVPGSDKRYDDARAILTAIDNTYEWLDPDVAGLSDELAAWQVSLSNKAKVVVRKDKAQPLRYLLKLGPAGKPNAQVGQVLFFVGSEQVAARPVVQLKSSGS
jgi:D-alanyl-D-alanine carboxypeptidase (penicillin-binding protein 5/6)